MTEYEPTGETSSDGPTTGATASGATPDRVRIGDGHIRGESQGGDMAIHRLPVDADAVESWPTPTERAHHTGRPTTTPGGRPAADGWRRPGSAAGDEFLDRPSAGRSTHRP